MAIRLDRNDRVRVYFADDFAGVVTGEPVDITMDQVPNVDFIRARQIIKLLTATYRELSREECADRSRWQGEFSRFGYHVEAGDYGCSNKDLVPIFAGSFMNTPVIVSELEGLLKRYASSADLVLKF